MSHGTKCNKGHTLKSNPAKNVKVCDTCNSDVEKGDTVWRCVTCDFDMCVGCHAAKSATDKAKHVSGVKSIFSKKSITDKSGMSAGARSQPAGEVPALIFMTCSIPYRMESFISGGGSLGTTTSAPAARQMSPNC